MTSALLEKISIENFKIFRNKQSFDLSSGTYFVGPNNSGKSTVLKAIDYFFDDRLYQQKDFLNQTLAASKKKDTNKSTVVITFDLTAIRRQSLKDSLKGYGDSLDIKKLVTMTATGTVKINYCIGSVAKQYEAQKLPDPIRSLLSSVQINYLHPQRGGQLLEEAQLKLKRRLLDNWGRAASMARDIRDIERGWRDFRAKATKYLSESLNTSMQRVWPDSDVNVALPKDIKEILEVSDISFSGYKGAPMVELLDQGSGAQSLILYMTHYMLDADRTLRRASEHHPIWLIEEPESFLHADLIGKLAKEFNSDEWVNNLQLIVSTHSSILLSRSRKLGDAALWHCLPLKGPPTSNPSSEWTGDDIRDMGITMGDPNFAAYFEASKPALSVYLEDSKPATLEAFKRAGIDVSSGIGGINEIKKALDAFIAVKDGLDGIPPQVFVIDNDQGVGSIKHLISKTIFEKDSFALCAVKGFDKGYLILLPKDWACEELFTELDNMLDEALNQILEPDLSMKSQTPTEFAQAVIKLRQGFTDRPHAKRVLRKAEDFKRYFWNKVDEKKLKINAKYDATLNQLIKRAKDNGPS